jgi:hypothetical protein
VQSAAAANRPIGSVPLGGPCFIHFWALQVWPRLGLWPDLGLVVQKGVPEKWGFRVFLVFQFAIHYGRASWGVDTLSVEGLSQV